MYSEIFERCITVVLLHEGGFQNNPKDRGNWTGPNFTGELKGTNKGIAARFFPNEDIKNLTVDKAKEIYFKNYWQPMNLTGIVNADSILEIFDMGVNSGKGNAIRMAQDLVGVKRDGVMGNITKEAINKFNCFLVKYKQRRIEYYMKIAKNNQNMVFLNGWLNRVVSTHF
jgi:lysozyme family protein